MATDTFDDDILGDGLGLLGADIISVPLPLEDRTSLDIAEETGDGAPEVSEELQAKVTGLLEDARKHYDEFVAPDQVEATNYYFGRPFGDEMDQRSAVVSTDVRDAILDRHPDLMEILAGSDAVVEFKARGAEDVALAAQQTDVVNHIYLEDNPGFLITNAVVKDSGVRRLAYTKWWWERTERVHGETFYAITEQDLEVLVSDEDVEDYSVLREYEKELPVEMPDLRDPTGQATVPVLMPTKVFDCEVRWVERSGRCRVAALPPEEVIWTPMSRSLDEAAVIAHTRDTAVEDVAALTGLSVEEVQEYRGQASIGATTSDNLRWSRSFYGLGGKLPSVGMETDDDPRSEVLFTEAYALVDADEDGVAELRMFQCLGNSYTIVNGPYGELVDEIPIAVFTEDPEPHTIPGLCAWDHTKDVQRIKSQIKRAQLNSLAQTVEPQFEIGPTVQIEDLLSPDINKFIRTRIMGQVREIKTTFVGPETLDMLAYYDQVKADRLGVAGPREGLDPNILQSTTAEAVESTLSKSQKRIKVVARMLAETGFKRMFRGILRLLVQHKGDWAGKAFEIRGEWVNIDPTDWDADRDLRVNVALGTGSKSEQIRNLLAIAEKQEAHIQSGSPLVSFVELRATYAKLSELLGHKDASMFWKRWSEKEQAQFEQAQANAPSSDPAMELVRVEEMKTQAQIALEAQKAEHQMAMKRLEVESNAKIEAANLALERWKIQLQDDRERDKIAREFVLKEKEVELAHQADLKEAELNAEVAADRKAQSKMES